MNSQFERSNEFATLFKFGELTFHDASRQLMHHGVELRLSPQARSILRLLLLSWPRPLSRDRLEEKLWPSTFFCETSVEEIMHELRTVLDGEAREASSVQAIDRIGYVLSPDVQQVSCPPLAAALVSGLGRHPLYEGESSVGRAVDNSIVLNDDRISRHHAVITVFSGRAWLRDLGSMNGTFVAGHSIGVSLAPLSSRSSICFGSLSASIVFCGSSAAAAGERDPERERPREDNHRPIMGVPVW